MSVRHVRNAHELLDQVELVEEAIVLGHWLIAYFAKSGHRHLFASKKTIARWLRADKGVRGCRRRAGRRGLAGTTTRHHLTAQSILNRLRALEAAGVVIIAAGGRALGKRFAGQKARGIKQYVRLAPAFHDMLRGATKPPAREPHERAPAIEPARCGIRGCDRVPCIPQLHAESAPERYEASFLEVPIGTTEEIGGVVLAHDDSPPGSRSS